MTSKRRMSSAVSFLVLLPFVGVTPSIVPASASDPLGPICPPWQVIQATNDYASKKQVKRLVEKFIGAYNQGDSEELDRIFAREPGFEGYYAAPERQGSEGENRLSLVAYFERRHKMGDRLDLLRLRFDRDRSVRGWEFFFVLVRESQQRKAQGTYVGKGAADCSISVWNMGPQ